MSETDGPHRYGEITFYGQNVSNESSELARIADALERIADLLEKSTNAFGELEFK